MLLLNPFAACPTLHTGAPVECRRCPAAPLETAEHTLLDCHAYADLRESARFAPLFENALPPQTRMSACASQKLQHLLGPTLCTDGMQSPLDNFDTLRTIRTP